MAPDNKILFKPTWLSRRRVNRRHSTGVALVITLLALALITIIAIAFLGTMTWEVAASRRDFENQRARAIASLGMKTAVAQIRQALGVWDNPLVNFTNTVQPTYYWSVSPGILTRWAYTSPTLLTNYPLFSMGTTNLVNLNSPSTDGSYPIIGDGTGLSVYWANVLANPAAVTSANNQIVGRYAFWVDDENAKININTADGTYNTNQVPQQCGLGMGTPSAVSLQVLPTASGVSLTSAIATNIVYIARTVGFNSAQEILRAQGTVPYLYSNNLFSLTSFSRSPDFNVFGQPKIPLIAVNTPGWPENAIPLQYNLATLQPPHEFYPTRGNLPSVALTNSTYPVATTSPFINGSTNYTIPWIGPFYQNESDSQTGTPNIANGYPNACWENGQFIADYLAGTNASGQAITWPAFSTTSPTSYLGKYTARQVDSIALQIVNLISSDSSPDFGNDFFCTTRSADIAVPGWLSNKIVCGTGRSPKLDKILIEFTTSAASGTPGVGGYIPPKVKAQLYAELWFPSHFQGTSLFHKEYINNNYAVGNQAQIGMLNSQDTCQQVSNPVGVAALFPKSPYMYTNSSGALPANYPDGSSKSLTYWGNNLLQTDKGVDWQGNPSSSADPDQDLATSYHSYLTQVAGAYPGAGISGSSSSPIFQMPFIVPKNSTNTDWYPGEVRCIENYASTAYFSDMSSAAGSSSSLNISGGMAFIDGINTSATGPFAGQIVPLDAGRGSTYPTIPSLNLPSSLSRTAETFLKNVNLYTNVLQAVIPVNISVPVAAANGRPAGTQKNAWVYDYVTDPLVNKFPGDWITASSGTTTPPTAFTTTTMSSYYAAAGTLQGDNARYATYPETSGSLTDPESYWLPTIDSNVTSQEAAQIPRTARFPSVGYLQYIRTGIIPDDETGTYSLQHGTPFRLLNFSASTSGNQVTTLAASKSYPDWAMLDLFYSPSSLLGYGSPYEALAGPVYATGATTPWGHTPRTVTYANTNIVNNMMRWGTYGGSTAGRINPNGSVLYTTNATIPLPNVYRTLPLQALFHGITVNPTTTGTALVGANDFHIPVQTPGTTVSDASLASLVASYIASNGPLRMPGEICNVPGVSAYSASINPTGTRNDLVRQVIGNLTTQSNTFSVWVASQSIVKSKSNLSGSSPNYGIWESGDQIISSVRYHFVVERYLDPGADGIYGMSPSPAYGAGTAPFNSNANDGITGTIDDPTDPNNNPKMPRYLYRVLYAEEIQ